MTEYRGNTRHRTRLVRQWLANPPPPPIKPIEVCGMPCPEEQCHSILLGSTPAEAADRLAEHKRRCHA